MSPLPHFVLVCGAWHTTEAWDHTRQLLMDVGYDTTPVELTSNGANPGVPDMSEDVAMIRKTTQQVIDRGLDAIVVLHSYAGLPGSEAMKALGKPERAAAGLPGGVIRLVIIAGYIVPEGFQDAQREDPKPPYDWMPWTPEDDRIHISVSDAKRLFYNDMEDSEAEKWANKLSTWSNGPRFGRSAYAAWRVIPTTYVLCSRDASLFGKWAQVMLDQAMSSKPCAVDTTETLESGHCPMISCPKELLAVLKRAAAAQTV